LNNATNIHWNTTDYGNYWSAHSGADSNGDGIIDTLYNGINGTGDTTTDYKPLKYKPLDDYDSDLLTNIEEWLNGSDGYKTNVTNADTDGDSLTDGQEFYGTNNTAFNNESTNPLVNDTDSDGLTDLEEVLGINNTAFSNEPTNPNMADTDDDGYDDLHEIKGGTDPNDPLYYG